MIEDMGLFSNEQGLTQFNVRTFRGPKIVWNRHDVMETIKEFGRDKAIERITADFFNKEYVTKMIDRFMSDTI